MPIRGLLYFSKMYEAYIKLNKLDLYGKSQVPLPTPQYVVFYNGRDEQPDERILTLSDAFMPKKEGIEPVLECRARMLNINYGHNEKILNTCKRLHDYSYFIAEVNSNLDKNMKLKDAIEKAIDICIEKGILADILIKHRAEVFDMLLTEYDEKLHMKTVKAEGYEEGRMAGEMAGFLKGEEAGFLKGEEAGFLKGEGREKEANLKKQIIVICKKIKKGLSLEDICEALEERQDVIYPIYHAVLKYNGDEAKLDEIFEELKKCL